MTKLRTVVFLTIYCAVTWFTLDYLYTTYLSPMGPSPRVQSEVYSHGLKAGFDGEERWGATRYRLHTNSLGFRDSSTRDVPLAKTTRRILLIGDSFTEGLGVPFGQTFAGLLEAEGQRRPNPVSFLNAAVVSYSPTNYYKKIKFWLEQGLQFDEVVVFSDISDVADEANANYCIDDRKKEPAGCAPLPPASTAAPSWNMRDSFNVSIRLWNVLRYYVQLWSGSAWENTVTANPRAIWTIKGAEADALYQPLGVEGGIKRSQESMQALAALLKSKGIALTVVVYPWPTQLVANDRDSRQVKIWRDFCASNCKAFIDLGPAFFAAKDAHADWYTRLFIGGDVHFSVDGHALVYEQVTKSIFQ